MGSGEIALLTWQPSQVKGVTIQKRSTAADNAHPLCSSLTRPPAPAAAATTLFCSWDSVRYMQIRRGCLGLETATFLCLRPPGI